MCTQNGGKLEKIHTEWMIVWNNVNKIKSLKKFLKKLVVWGIITNSSENMERLCEMAGFESEM